MKKAFKLIAIFIVLMMAFSVFVDCYGGFHLFKRIHSWNGTMGNKWVKTIVYLVLWIIPVYEICLVADFLVLNTLEFWTGSNPMAMREGDREIQVVRHEGDMFRITATRNRFDVEQLTGRNAGYNASLVFDTGQNAWYVESAIYRERVVQVSRSNPDQVRVFYPDGTSVRHSLAQVRQD